MKNDATVDPPGAEVNLGARLRELRASRGLSIRALAERSGLNVNTLSLIENDKTSPSVSTLQQVAAALRVPITAFFERRAAPQAIVFQKAGQRQSADFAHGSLADLKAGFARPGLEPFVVTLEPELRRSRKSAGSGAGYSGGAEYSGGAGYSGDTPIVHTGLEFVYCLEGSLGYEVDGQTFLLEAGDSLIFEAHLPHRWRNAGSTPSRSLLILCPADERDHPDERHFP